MKKNQKHVLLVIIFLIAIFIIAAITIIRARRTPERLILRIEDVSSDDWFYRYVLAGLRFGLIDVGRDNYHFEPDRYVTQGEFITMLGRLHEFGHGTIRRQPGGERSERYVDWALERGIICYDDYWVMMPYAFITREQMAVIVYRYINAFELHDYFQSEYVILIMLNFMDLNRVSQWAREPVEWLRQKFVISSDEMWYFRPLESATHAEMLQIIVRVGSATYDLIHPLW